MKPNTNFLRMVGALMLVLCLGGTTAAAQEPEPSSRPAPDTVPAPANEAAPAGQDTLQQQPPIPVPGPATTRPRPPLSVNEKFHYAVKRGFGPSSIGGAFATGAWQQWRNDNTGYGQGADGYFKRVGSRYAKTATKHMLGSFMLASMFGQDPRYGRSELQSKRARLFYAVSRVIITRGDNGRTQFNISGVGGTMGAAFISSTWHNPPDNTMRRALSRTGVSLGIEGLRNIIREFWPDIRRKVRRD